MNIELVKEPNPYYEVLSILNSTGSKNANDQQLYLRSINYKRQHYVKKLKLTEEEADRYFALLEEIEEYVLFKANLTEDIIDKYFTPIFQDSTVADMIFMADVFEVFPEKIPAFIYGFLLEDPSVILELNISFEDFFKKLSSMELTNEVKWKLADLVINWQSHKKTIFEILERAVEAFNEKSYLAKELIDFWINTVEEDIYSKGFKRVMENNKIVIDNQGEYFIYPALEAFSGLAMRLGSLNGKKINIFYGVHFDTFGKMAKERVEDDEKILKRLKTINDKKRLEILRVLKDSSKYASDLVEITGLSAATVSHHMSELVSSDFVNIQKEGTKVKYMLNVGAIEEFLQSLTSYLL